MTGKQQFGLFLGLAAVTVGTYLWYKNRLPKFQILGVDGNEKTVKWSYGNIINIAKFNQNNTYASSPNSDCYVNVASIEDNKNVVGIRFNFLGKDSREPVFVYFQ